MIPADIQELLSEGGVPWRAEQGGKHLKLFIGGRLMIVPKSYRPDTPGRANKNMRATIRRIIRETSK